MRMASWRASVAWLLVAFLLISACSAPESGNSRVQVLPNPSPVAESEQPRTDVVLGSSQLRLVYTLVLQRFIEQVDHRYLVEAGLASLRTSVAEVGALPLDTAMVDLAPLPGPNADQDWLRLASAYESVVQRYPDWALKARPDYQLLDDLLAGLDDRHTTFITAEENRRRKETVYSGIGVRLARPVEAEPPRVSEVFAGTPAAQAGLKAGDRIVAVEGRPIAGLPLQEVVDLIRGPEGSAVALTVERIGGQGSAQFRLTRRSVDVPLVTSSLRNGAGYVRIRGFTEEIPDQVVGAVEKLAAEGARGWILDLRGNGGGRLTAVQSVAGVFLSDKQIGIEESRARERVVLLSRGTPVVGEAPMVVLIDGDTNSGAEILSAALRVHRGAVLVGERTAGNVAVAEEHALPDGSAAQITVRRFHGPEGEQLDKVGVSPDVEVALIDAELAAGEDPQLNQALRLLQAQAR